MLELQPQPPAARNRAYRARRRRGAVVVSLEIEPDAAVALATAGLIDEDEVTSRDKIKAGLELFLFCLAENSVELDFLDIED